MPQAHVRPGLLAFGANVPGAWGDPAASIRRAIALLPERGVRIEAVSSFHQTAPMGPPQPAYVNAAARITTALEPDALLAVLKQLEAEAGRRPGERWGPRPLDIDILDFGGIVQGWLDGKPATGRRGLVLPHPGLHERTFVLAPLAEVAPEGWRHPVLGLDVAAMLAALRSQEP
jgi:2-amino-4-hydroxy-6-hydroxymethyldihydropteridine diphosphokinase